MRAAVWLVLATAACESASEWPGAELHAIDPDRIGSFEAATINIIGAGLFVDVATGVVEDRVRTRGVFTGTLGGETLADLTWVNNDLLSATTPELPEGIYDLEIETPRGGTLVLQAALSVRDDLSGGAGGVERTHTSIELLPASDTVVDRPLDPAVEAARSVLFFNVRHTSLSPSDGHVTGQIVDNGEAVRFHRYGTGIDIDIAWTVLQHESLSVQRGGVPHLDSPNTVTLTTPVDVDASFPLATLRISGGAYNFNDWVRAELTGPSTLVLSSGIDEQNPNAVVEWQVVSFVPEATAHVAVATLDLDGGDLTAAVPTGPLRGNRSLMVFTQHSLQSFNYAAANLVRGQLGADELRFDRQAADIDVRISAYLVTWPALTVEHGSLHFAAGEFLRRAVLSRCPRQHSAVVSFLPGQMRQGRSAHSSDDRVGEGWFTSALEDEGCSVVVERAAASSEADAAWTVFWLD